MSPEELARLRELAAKATIDWPSMSKRPELLSVSNRDDLAHIAAACNALPKLLDEVERLRRRVTFESHRPEYTVDGATVRVGNSSDMKTMDRIVDKYRARVARLEEALREIVGRTKYTDDDGEIREDGMRRICAIARAALATEGASDG